MKQNLGSSISQNILKSIFVAGLIVGTLDILAAIGQTLVNERSPINMLKFIASGIFGSKALKGGSQYAWYGLFFHYCIAMGWSTILFLIYPKIKFFHNNRLLTGLIYGFIVWIIMNQVILPLSNTPPLPFTLDFNLIKSLIIIIAAVGLPMAFLASRYYK